MNFLKVLTWRDRAITGNGTRNRTKNHKRKNSVVSFFHVGFGSILILKKIGDIGLYFIYKQTNTMVVQQM